MYWNFLNDNEVKNKIVAEYGDLMTIPDEKAKEILEKYADIDAVEAEFSEEGEIKYKSALEAEEEKREQEELEREWIDDPYKRNGVSHWDFL